MKSLFLGLLTLLYTFSCLAQTKKPFQKTSKPILTKRITKHDRSKPPHSGPTPIVNIGKYQSFELSNGLKVYVIQNKKIPIVSFSLVLDYDPILEKNHSGYVSMAGDLLKMGTSSRSKDQIDEEIGFLGASFSTSSRGFYASSLKQNTEKLLEIISDVVKNPSFPANQLDRMKKETLSIISNRKDNPQAIADLVNNILIYGETHPYGEPTSEATINNISLSQVKDFYNNYYRPNIGHLAIVGDVTLENAKAWTEKYFSSWPKGNVPHASYPNPIKPNKPRIVIVDKPNSEQSIIRIGMSCKLSPSDSNLLKALTMNDILGGGTSRRLFYSLREKSAFAYGAYSSLVQDKFIGKFSASVSVRSEVADSAIQEFIHEINLIRDTQPTEEELKKSISSQTDSFLMSLEKPTTIANFAISTARYRLPSNYYQNYLKNLSKVNGNDIQNAAKSLLNPDNLTILVVGKASEIEDKLKKFGDIEYFSTEGKKTTANLLKPIPSELTSEMVLANYINKIGGKEELLTIKDISSELTANIQGNQLSAKVLRKAPNLYSMTIIMGSQEMGKTVSDGKSYKSIQMGQKREISDSEMKQRMMDQHLWLETKVAEFGITMNLIGIEIINDEDAYKIEFTLPNKVKYFEYYGVSSQLKLKKIETRETPSGLQQVDIDFLDYKKVDGILMPHKIIQKTGNQTVVFQVKSIKFNSKIKDSQFKVD